MLIKLTNSAKMVKIDKKCFIKVSKHNYFVSDGYVFTTSHPHTQLHRILLDVPDNLVVDHIDGDPLNNRLRNLRICTTAQNSKNRNLCRYNKNGYPDIEYLSKSKKWRARIKNDGIRYHIGCFKDKVEAAYIRDQFAMQLHGEYARLYLID